MRSARAMGMRTVVIAVLKVSSCSKRYVSRRKVHERERRTSSGTDPVRTKASCAPCTRALGHVSFGRALGGVSGSGGVGALSSDGESGMGEGFVAGRGVGVSDGGAVSGSPRGTP